MNRMYVVDLDGTVADARHRLHFINGELPPDWDSFFAACGDDQPIVDVIWVVKALAASGGDRVGFVYATGRPERVRAATTAWLDRYGLPTGRLIMRRDDDDRRPDTVAKREMMEALTRSLLPGWRLAGVFEDRPAVCRVWREMGLTCFQMQHEEF